MRSCAILCLLLSLAGAALGQSTGTVNGRVVDQAGAVVPDASVTAVNEDTGITRTTKTNGDGLYSIPALEPGQYDIKVDMKGFASSETKGAKLVTNSIVTADFSL